MRGTHSINKDCYGSIKICLIEHRIVELPVKLSQCTRLAHELPAAVLRPFEDFALIDLKEGICHVSKQIAVNSETLAGHPENPQMRRRLELQSDHAVLNQISAKFASKGLT